jgi:hypothetical protein
MAATRPPIAPLAHGVFSRIAPPLPLRSFLRAAAYRLNPPQPVPHVPAVRRACQAVFERAEAEPRQAAALLCERRAGDRPTIVLGGFVPDSTEQVFLLRGMLLRHGSVYYFNYPRRGFSIPMLCAQIDDLVEELRLRGQSPVILSVSFGVGIMIEWLRRWKASRRGPAISGALAISPVACSEDVLDPSAPKATTLLGRALRPFGDCGAGADPSVVERARTIFLKMFEAGANNRAALAGLLSPDELRRIRAAVTSAIHGIDAAGALERVGALRRLAHPASWADCGLPLSPAPTLILYAEKEDSVIAATSPTRRILESDHLRFFPWSECRVVRGGASPVQHASLIFHHYQFLPHIAAFYRGSKLGKFAYAA